MGYAGERNKLAEIAKYTQKNKFKVAKLQDSVE